MFLIISLVLIPTMLIYKTNKQQGILGLEKPSFKSAFHALSIGNLGGAQTKCITKRLDADEKKSISIKLTCSNGQNARIVYKDHQRHQSNQSVMKFGVMSKELEDKSFCDNEKIFENGKNKDIVNCGKEFEYQYSSIIE